MKLDGESNRVLDIPAILNPLGTRDAKQNRLLGGEGRPHRLEDLDQETGPVLKAAA